MEVVFPKGDAIVSPQMQSLVRAVIAEISTKFDLQRESRPIDIRFMLPENMPPNAEGATNCDLKDRVEMVILYNIQPVMLLATLCHEMVHVRDAIRGDLKTTDEGTTFRGKFYPSEFQALANLLPTPKIATTLLPWEEEAYDTMFPLAQEIFQKLPADNKKYVVESTSQLKIKPGANSDAIHKAGIQYLKQVMASI